MNNNLIYANILIGDNMKIEKVITGTLEENCYVLIKNNTCLVVDPGDDYHKIKEVIGDNKVLGVLITHSHFDHVGALRHFLTKRSVKIFKKSNTLEKEYAIGDFKFEGIHTLIQLLSIFLMIMQCLLVTLYLMVVLEDVIFPLEI